MKTPRSYTQGYNVQAVVNEQQIVLAAEVTPAHRTSVICEPMVKATQARARGDWCHRDARGRGCRQRLLE